MQEFHIRQNATMPLLVMKINKDNQVQFLKIHKMLENSVISFSMKNANNGNFKISGKPASIIKKNKLNETINLQDQYYICYPFTSEDTNTPGEYIGEFKISFLDENGEVADVFIAPVQETLRIYIKESIS